MEIELICENETEGSKEILNKNQVKKKILELLEKHEVKKIIIDYKKN